MTCIANSFTIHAKVYMKGRIALTVESTCLYGYQIYYYIAGLILYVYTVLEFLICICSSYVATTLLSLNEMHIDIIRT